MVVHEQIVERVSEGNVDQPCVRRLRARATILIQNLRHTRRKAGRSERTLSRRRRRGWSMYDACGNGLRSRSIITNWRLGIGSLAGKFLRWRISGRRSHPWSSSVALSSTSCNGCCALCCCALCCCALCCCATRCNCTSLTWPGLLCRSPRICSSWHDLAVGHRRTCPSCRGNGHNFSIGLSRVSSNPGLRRC